MTTATSITDSNMTLFIKTGCKEVECSICYKPVGKLFFACSAPCNKVFHTSCMEKAMEQTEEAAYDEDEEAQHRCCYCRRNISVDSYQLQLLARHLLTLRSQGHDVRDALKKVETQLKTGIYDEEFSYEIFEVRDVDYYQKKPKQSKRAEYQKKTLQKKEPRIRVKQNIGGRRR
jgi:hypothetical protein